MSARPICLPDVPASALEALQAVYRDLDTHLRALGVECRACGACCDFLKNDFRLYASLVELALVMRHGGLPRLTASGRCGFLADGRCSVHPWRPLGCRVFFCDPAHKPREQEIYHALQRQLRVLTDRHSLPWDYAPFFGSVPRELGRDASTSSP